MFGNHPDQSAVIHWNYYGNDQIGSDLMITQWFRWDYLTLVKKKGPRERPLMFLHTIIDDAYWRWCPFLLVLIPYKLLSAVM